MEYGSAESECRSFIRFNFAAAGDAGGKKNIYLAALTRLRVRCRRPDITRIFHTETLIDFRAFRSGNCGRNEPGGDLYNGGDV